MRVLFLIGLPASGKSSFRDILYANAMDNGVADQYVIVSSDDELERIAISASPTMTYNEAFQNKKHVDLAMFRANTAFNDALDAEKFIVLDRTNMSRKSRASYIELAKRHRYECDALVFARPMTNAAHNEWNRRLDRPRKTIPNSTLQQMFQSYQEPTVEEGFTNILHVDTYEGFD